MAFLTLLHERLALIDQKISQGEFPDAKELLRIEEEGALFQRAILSGEYIVDDESTFRRIYSDLIRIGTFIRTLPKENTTNDKDLKDISDSITRIRTQFYLPFEAFAKDSRENLLRFSEGKESTLSDPRRYRDYALNFPDNTNKVQYEVIFQVNLTLAYIDENLESGRAFLYDLSTILGFLEYITSFDSGQYKQIIEVLKDKAEYLEFKIRYRNALPESDIVEIERNFDTIKNGQSSYKEFLEKTKLHYNHLSRKTIEEQVEEFEKEKKFEDIKLEAFHHLNHFLDEDIRERIFDVKRTDVHKAELDSFLQRLIVKQKLLPPPPESDKNLVINKVAMDSIKTILENTSLYFEYYLVETNEFIDIVSSFRKYFLEGKDEPSIIKEYLEKLKGIAEKDNFKDYYCYILFLDFLGKLIVFFRRNYKKIIEPEPGSDPSVDKIDRHKRLEKITEILLDGYSVALEKLNASYYVLSTHRPRPVYLTIRDCSTIFTWEDGSKSNLFLHSSYTVPYNLTVINNKIEYFRFFYSAQSSSFQSTLEIFYAQAMLNAEVDKKLEYSNTVFDKKVKDNEFKVVQIVAMFVSIATFVLINVKIFDGKSGLESFGIILGLAACFILFNLFFYLIVHFRNENEFDEKERAKRRKGNNRMLWKILAPAVLAGSASFGILMLEGGKTTDIKSIHSALHTDTVLIDSSFRSINSMNNALFRDSVYHKLEDRLNKLEHPSLKNSY